tara:strand:+ start:735 stop:902 length:168 start_codon:yes stop_codon:yes gene_type:complete
MPLWLRKFTYAKIKGHYDKQSEMMKKQSSNQNQKEVIGKDGMIKMPGAFTKSSYK